MKRSLLVVTLDHIPLGLMQGWEYAENTLQAILEGRPDLVIANFGIIKRFSSMFEGGPGMILRLDGSPSYLVEDWRRASRWDLLYRVEDALRLGASGVIVNILVGSTVEMSSICAAARIAGDCLQRQLPLVISAIPATEASDHNGAEVAAFASRLAAEIGADVVNSYYDGNASGLEYLVSVCPQPVLLAGGVMRSDAETLKRASLAISSGCAGVCFGRSIWQSTEPVNLMLSLRALLNGSGESKLDDTNHMNGSTTPAPIIGTET